MTPTPEPVPYTVEDVEAGVRVLHANRYDGPDDLDENARIEIVALVLSTVAPKIREAAHRVGREEAAELIRAHADQHAPADGNIQQRRMRRHLLIAARVAAPKPTLGEVAEALAAGNYAACYLDEAGQSVPPGGAA